jgi:dynein heavy chain
MLFINTRMFWMTITTSCLTENIRKDCFMNIIDVEFPFQYEYHVFLTCPVVAPFTDQWHITFSQYLCSNHDSATVGPAWTVRMETVKDLSWAMEQICFVFNCSEQMDHKLLAAIFKGLSRSAACRCFDEFNIIAYQVL